MSSWVIGVINIIRRVSGIIKGFITWRQNLPMQRNVEGQIGIVVQNKHTNSTSAIAKTAKK